MDRSKQRRLHRRGPERLAGFQMMGVAEKWSEKWSEKWAQNEQKLGDNTKGMFWETS